MDPNKIQNFDHTEKGLDQEWLQWRKKINLCIYIICNLAYVFWFDLRYFISSFPFGVGNLDGDGVSEVDIDLFLLERALKATAAPSNDCEKDWKFEDP